MSQFHEEIIEIIDVGLAMQQIDRISGLKYIREGFKDKGLNGDLILGHPLNDLYVIICNEIERLEKLNKPPYSIHKSNITSEAPFPSFVYRMQGSASSRQARDLGSRLTSLAWGLGSSAANISWPDPTTKKGPPPPFKEVRPSARSTPPFSLDPWQWFMIGALAVCGVVLLTIVIMKQ